MYHSHIRTSFSRKEFLCNLPSLPSPFHFLPRWSHGSVKPDSGPMGNCLNSLRHHVHHVKPEGDVKVRTSSVKEEDKANGNLPTDPKVEYWRRGSAAKPLIEFDIEEVKSITGNFKPENLIGAGGFGKVYKGFILENLRPGVRPIQVAVKVHDGAKSCQGHREWLTEVKVLGQISHPYLVELVGYCCEDDHRVLVYEYMAGGSAENHLFKGYTHEQVDWMWLRASMSLQTGSVALCWCFFHSHRSVSPYVQHLQYASMDPLPWAIRMKIAFHAAKGLAFLHESEQPVIYRDFKTSNILLDMDYNAKLSDFGLAKDGPVGDNSHVSTRVMGTYGYAAPEYIRTGHLTASSDVYSFGIVLLELITGRKSLDKSRPPGEQNLADWVYPMLIEKKKLPPIIDPRLEKNYPVKGVHKAARLACHCLNSNPKARPLMRDIVDSLEPLQVPTEAPGNFKN